MLARLDDEWRECQHHIKECERRAADPLVPPVCRRDFKYLAESWRRLASSLEFAVRVSAYIEWSAQRIK